MNRFLENLFLLCAIIGTEAWFLDGYHKGQPEWEPALALVAAIGALLLKEPIKNLLNEPSSRHDRELFDRFLNEFPSNGAVARFLKEHDLGVPFSSAKLDKLDEFAESWNNAEHMFHSSQLESFRSDLMQNIRKFRHELALNVSAGNSPGVLTMGIRDWEDRPEVIQKKEELNELASSIYTKHQKLVELGTRMLKT